MTITDRKIKYEAVIQHNAQRRHKKPQEQVNVEQDVKFPPISVCFDEIGAHHGVASDSGGLHADHRQHLRQVVLSE